jgi:D-serine dehydratase
VSVLSLPRLNLAVLEQQLLDPSTKGLPPDAGNLSLQDIGLQNWSVLAGDLPMPLAVIRQSVLRSNSSWMSTFASLADLQLAPHGKTTMAPHLFDLQIADGAWAITVATTQQMNVCLRYGVRRILIANQPVGRQELVACFKALRTEVELYCLADTLEGVEALGSVAGEFPPPSSNPLRVLVELGYSGGRTGARSTVDALGIARAVSQTPGLQLAGFECFEGQLPTTEAVNVLLDTLLATAAESETQGTFEADRPMILSAGGSSFFDRVGEKLTSATFSRPVQKVLRSGCYLTHDSIGYAHAFQRIKAESTLKLPPGGLEPALEVWAYVQSRPERGRSILTVGKRDISHDMGLPVPLLWYRADGSMEAPTAVPDGHKVIALSDQHCHLETPESSPLRVGDMVAFGIGHPCTTFDKWQLLMLVDDHYNVTGAIRTYF